tara:strand:+ start:18132 stop:20033 length:1902 start_codon:yes stop_codon:yes gene_type:complete
MCGINGIISNSPSSKKELNDRINTMNNLIIHRGPDDDGIFVETGPNYGIAMGMRRLAIIDLHSGMQPITSEDGEITIVFNGEIYNFLQLKNSLLEKGINFNTSSDTEVILKLYENEGESSFAKLDGMFGFSIYDKRINKVLIARDFFGEKPLYYCAIANNFIWASELKSIINDLKKKPQISKTGLNHFLRLTYIPAPHTIYEDIHKLEANHYISYDLENKSFQIKEIDNSIQPNVENYSFESAKNITNILVRKSVESRSISDVPLGTWLSGGVDSSIISLCLSQMKDTKIDTFSIGFEKKSFDESDKSQLIAKQIDSNHHEFIIGEDDLKNNIHEILLNFDEPFSDTAALPTYLVSRKTRDYVKVTLTGDGGDEVFGGYNKYYVGKLNSKYTNLVPKFIHDSFLKIGSTLLSTKDDKRGKRFKAKKMLDTINYDGDFYWDIISLANTKNQLAELLLKDKFLSDPFKEYKDKTGIHKPSTVNEFRAIDKILSLEGGMLPKVDRTSMLNSLECRSPFLNKEIWNFTNTLPESFLMKGWDKKYILKKAFEHEFPEKFLDKSKQGFNSPVGDWLRSGLRKELESYIEPKFLKTQDIFNVDTTSTLILNHLSSKKDNTYSVWAFYCFQKWYVNTYLQI